MPRHEAEAVILRQYPLSEADRIIVCVTREFGLLRAVAKGARKVRSRLGPSLEPLNHVRMQFYLREGGELARIWQCELMHAYFYRNTTIERAHAYSYFAELTMEMFQENNPNPLMFRLLLAVLRAGERRQPGEALLRYFELWMLRLGGLLPDYDHCSRCGKCVKQSGFYAGPGAGQLMCDECARSQGVRVGEEAAGLIRQALARSPEEFVGLVASGRAAREMENFTQGMLEFHLEKKLKSYGAWKLIKGMPN